MSPPPSLQLGCGEEEVLETPTASASASAIRQQQRGEARADENLPQVLSAGGDDVPAGAPLQNLTVSAHFPFSSIQFYLYRAFRNEKGRPVDS